MDKTIQQKLKKTVDVLFPQVTDFWGVKGIPKPHYSIQEGNDVYFDTSKNTIVVGESRLPVSGEEKKTRAFINDISEEMTHYIRHELGKFKDKSKGDVQAEEFLGHLSKIFFGRKGFGGKQLRYDISSLEEGKKKNEKELDKALEKGDWNNYMKGLIKSVSHAEHNMPYKKAEEVYDGLKLNEIKDLINYDSGKIRELYFKKQKKGEENIVDINFIVFILALFVIGLILNLFL